MAPEVKAFDLVGGPGSVDTARVRAGGLATVRQAPRVPYDAAPSVDSAPADALLHPVSLVALVLLITNDHVLKAAWPGPVTGKLSDVAGLVFFPILVLSAGELALLATGRWRGPTRRALALAVGGAAAAFALAKTVPVGAEAAGWLLGLAQWSLSLPVRAITGAPLAPVVPAQLIVDPTDLLALPFVALAVWIGRSRLR